MFFFFLLDNTIENLIPGMLVRSGRLLKKKNKKNPVISCKCKQSELLTQIFKFACLNFLLIVVFLEQSENRNLLENSAFRIW